MANTEPNFDEASVKAERLIQECKAAQLTHLFIESPHWNDTRESAMAMIMAAYFHTEKGDMASCGLLLSNAVQMVYLRGYQRGQQDTTLPIFTVPGGADTAMDSDG